jgi:hypothetical protein
MSRTARARRWLRLHLTGNRQRYRNWLNRRARARGKAPLPDRVTRGAGSRTPVYRNRVNPATGRPRWTDRNREALDRWRASRPDPQPARLPRKPGIYDLRDGRWTPARDVRAPDLSRVLPRGRTR